MNASVEVTEVRPRLGLRPNRHPLGVIAVLLSAVSLVVQLVAVSSVGLAAANMRELYGRELVQIPFGELPPSISVYVVIIALAWIGWGTALVLGIVAFSRLRCRVCGTIAMAISAATLALSAAVWFTTSTGAIG